ncbi:XdhC family protein [Puniceicoccaceae bacterium K14]|nr:XdhC family protein [Puniceicoccaceae bacterium K14]
MIDYWQTIQAELEQGHRVFIALVVQCSKGSPGTPGAKLLLSQSGFISGTIGGGIMERNLLTLAQKSLREDSYPPTLQKIQHRRDTDSPSGLICGGGQINVLAVLEPERDLSLALKIVQTLKQQQKQTLVLSPEGIKLAPDSSSPTKPIQLLDHPINWQVKLKLANHDRVLIAGAGHCGQALARQMQRLNFHVTLVDQRESIPGIESLSGIELRTGTTVYSNLHYDSFASLFVVVMTHSYPTDIVALTEILPNHPRFLGLMGSQRKLNSIFEELRQQGFSQQQLDKITAPVGLPIGSDTPEEIAVSIAAQILLKRNFQETDAHKETDYVLT